MPEKPRDDQVESCRREIEKRWQLVWERGLREAIGKGLPHEIAARTMLGAAVKVLLEVDGPERVAFYLGRLAYEFDPAGEAGEAIDPANLNYPPRH